MTTFELICLFLGAFITLAILLIGPKLTIKPIGLILIVLSGFLIGFSGVFRQILKLVNQ